MVADSGEAVLKNGLKVVLRGLTEDDAEAQADHLMAIYAESDFMLRYPEEFSGDVEDQRAFIRRSISSERDFHILAFLDGKMIGDAGIHTVYDGRKCRHRAEIGISIRKDYWDLGLGTAMLRAVIEQTKANGFEQIELGVYEDNTAAVRLYEKFGFRRVGAIPRAFKLKDGTYRDEILMVCIL